MQQPADLARFAVIDIETNGLSPSKDDIIEIAVVHPEGPTLVLDTLLKPKRRIGNRELHGITNRDVRHAPLIADIAGHLLDALVGRVVVAHNARFDVPFIERALDQIGVRAAFPSLCTLELHKVLFGRKCDLEQACAELGVPSPSERHRAAGDALSTAGLLRAQLEKTVDLVELPFVSEEQPITETFARSVPGRGSLFPRTPRSSS